MPVLDGAKPFRTVRTQCCDRIEKGFELFFGRESVEMEISGKNCSKGKVLKKFIKRESLLRSHSLTKHNGAREPGRCALYGVRTTNPYDL